MQRTITLVKQKKIGGIVLFSLSCKWCGQFGSGSTLQLS
jgi:hypothetical protein